VGAAISALCLWHGHAAMAQQSDTAAQPESAAKGSVVLLASEPNPRHRLDEVDVYGQRLRDDFLSDNSSVGAKTATRIQDIPQTIVSVDSALMQSEAVASFADALRNVPGVTMAAAEGGSIGNNINLRGFSARTDIYLDGFRDRGQYYRDTFDLHSIDVLYGPSSMLFGRGSTGGVINQVTKHPGPMPAEQINVTAGSYDYYRATVDANTPLSATSAVRFNAFGQDVGSSRAVMKNKDYGFAPSLAFGMGEPTKITLFALLQHNRDQPDYGVPALNGRPAPVERARFYGYTDDRTLQDVQSANVLIEHDFGDGGPVLRNQMQFSHYGTDARETNPAGVLTGAATTSPALSNGNYTTLAPATLFVKLASKDRIIEDHSWYNTTELSGRVNSGAVHQDLLAGVDLGYESYGNQSYSAHTPGQAAGTIGAVSLLDPAYTARPAGTVDVPGNHAQSAADSLGVYVNDTASLGRQFKLVAGLRWDRFSADIRNTSSAPAYGAQTNFFTSVRGGAIWQPDALQTYYASYGTSFDPSLEALTLTSGQQDLPPEKSRSYEVGSKYTLRDGRLLLTQSLFNTEQDNVRTKDIDGNYTIAGNIRVRGYQLGVSGRLTGTWQLYGGYTYLDARILSASDGTAGNLPANVPHGMLTLWSTWRPVQHWELGGGATYVGSRYAATNDLVKVDGYIRWDATVAYHARHYDLRLNVLNLTDRNYYDSIIQSDGGRAVPGIGRTFLGTASYRF
jgi:catecholate siderophore receptor